MNSPIKFNKAIVLQVVVPLLMSLLLLTFNHCNIELAKQTNSKSRKVSSENTQALANPAPGVSTEVPIVEGGGDEPDPVVEEIVIQEVNVGVKSFEELNASMSVLTGIPTAQVENTYNSIVTQLPTSNDVKSFLGVHQVSIMKLAAEYCHRLVDDATQRAIIWPTTNFGENAVTALFGAKRQAIIDNAIINFWRADNAKLATMTMEKNELNAMVDELLVGMATNNSTTTRNVIKGMCTSILSSSPVTML